MVHTFELLLFIPLQSEGETFLNLLRKRRQQTTHITEVKNTLFPTIPYNFVIKNKAPIVILSVFEQIQMKNSFSTPYYLKNPLKFVSYQKKGWNAEITGSKKQH